MVSAWHTPMLQDSVRNRTYEMGLRRALQACKSAQPLVLEIGGGSGLLSMFAVRHGAHQVVTVEAQSNVAALSREIIADNKMSDKIRVVSKHSAALRLGDGNDQVTCICSSFFFCIC